MDSFLPAPYILRSTPHIGGATGKGYVSLDKTTQLPASWINHDDISENGLQDLPYGLGPESKTMTWWMGRKKAEWWKFSAYGFDGLPRELKHITSADTQ
jgi:hypothetical protein